MTARIGDVYAGKGGGRKQIERWDWDRESEEICAKHDDIDRDAFRGAWVLTGEARKRRWADLSQLAAWSDPITVGDGNGPPWEWQASLGGKVWEHPDGRRFGLYDGRDHPAGKLWILNGMWDFRGTGHASTFKPAGVLL